MIRVHVPLRVAIAATALPVVLATAVAAGAQRSHHELPRARAQLTAALSSASELSACLQEAQDELYPAGGLPSDRSRQEALARLSSCPSEAFTAAVNDVTVPRAAAADDAQHQRARGDLSAAVEVLHRAALNARAVVERSRRDASHPQGDASALVLGFRAFEAARLRADVLLTQLDADLR